MGALVVVKPNACHVGDGGSFVFQSGTHVIKKQIVSLPPNVNIQYMWGASVSKRYM